MARMARWWHGRALKALRARRRLTQAALAKKMRVHQVTIARLETDARRPSMAMLHRLAKALDVKMARLLE